VGITVYATLLYRENRVRGFLTGSAPIPAGALLATGIGLALLVLWSRDAVLRGIEDLTPDLGLPVALLMLMIAILAVQGSVSALFIGRRTIEKTGAREE
jgi:hypothetical protein